MLSSLKIYLFTTMNYLWSLKKPLNQGLQEKSVLIEGEGLRDNWSLLGNQGGRHSCSKEEGKVRRRKMVTREEEEGKIPLKTNFPASWFPQGMPPPPSDPWDKYMSRLYISLWFLGLSLKQQGLPGNNLHSTLRARPPSPICFHTASSEAKAVVLQDVQWFIRPVIHKAGGRSPSA